MSVTAIADASQHMAMRELLETLLTDIGTRGQSFTSGALAVGNNQYKMDLIADVHYRINGVNYKKAAANDISMNNCTQQAVSTKAKYLFSIDANGTITTTKGNSVTVASNETPELPALPANSAPIGYLLIETDANNAWRSSANNVASAYANTIVNLGIMPLTTAA